jgi:hypothetical protein
MTRSNKKHMSIKYPYVFVKDNIRVSLSITESEKVGHFFPDYHNDICCQKKSDCYSSITHPTGRTSLPPPDSPSCPRTIDAHSHSHSPSVLYRNLPRRFFAGFFACNRDERYVHIISGKTYTSASSKVLLLRLFLILGSSYSLDA